jgi:hypothetical protein
MRARAARLRNVAIPLMLCWNSIRLVLPDMLPKGVGGAAEYPGDVRVVCLGSKAAAFFLNLSKRFWASRHNAARLERHEAGNY